MSTDTFSYTGSYQVWTVPAGVLSVIATLHGASGGGEGYYGDSNPATLGVTGGQPGRLIVSIPVTPSQAWLDATAMPIPEPAPAEITLADVAAALRDPLANLTDSSASTTVRTAILNQRAALDALLAQLDGNN